MRENSNKGYWIGSVLIIIAIISILVLGASGWFAGKEEKNGPLTNPDTPPPEFAAVNSIIDAITIELDTGHIVRYLGVRAPDVMSQVECFGPEAVKANENILGEEVRLEEDPVLLRAQDGAWVRYVYLQQEEQEEPPLTDENPDEDTPATEEAADTAEDDVMPPADEEAFPKDADVVDENDADASPESPAGNNEIFINEKILEGGFAFPLVSEDMIYGERMLSAARFASATGKGLWSRCEVSDETGTFKTEVLEECVIKGKITNREEKIYRTPACPAYRQTLVLESQGDKWFCAEDIAEDDGFSKASDCP